MNILVLQLLPIVRDVDQLSADVIDCSEAKNSASEFAFPAPPRRFGEFPTRPRFLSAGLFTRSQDFIRHVRIGAARAHAIDLDIVSAPLRPPFRPTGPAPPGCGIGGEETRPGCRGARPAEHDDFSRTPLNHVRQHGPACVHHAYKIHLDCLGERFSRLLGQPPDGPRHTSRAYQDLHAAVIAPHTSTAALTCSKSVTSARMRKRVAARVLYFKVRKVEFAFAAGEQPTRCPAVAIRAPALPNAASRAGTSTPV